jgi:hypothetical protein
MIHSQNYGALQAGKMLLICGILLTFANINVRFIWFPLLDLYLIVIFNKSVEIKQFLSKPQKAGSVYNEC